MSIRLRKFIAFLLVRIAFKVCPESKAVKEFAQYLATSAMIDGGYVQIVKPQEIYKEPTDGELRSAESKVPTNQGKIEG